MFRIPTKVRVRREKITGRAMLLRCRPAQKKKDCRLAILFVCTVVVNPKLFFELLNPDVSVSYGVQVVLQRNGNGRVRQTREAAVG